MWGDTALSGDTAGGWHWVCVCVTVPWGVLALLGGVLSPGGRGVSALGDRGMAPQWRNPRGGVVTQQHLVGVVTCRGGGQ